jgi:hypothetical protein
MNKIILELVRNHDGAIVDIRQIEQSEIIAINTIFDSQPDEKDYKYVQVIKNIPVAGFTEDDLLIINIGN